ncbi:MAG: DUF4234 domain-containing protein [Defluviitaleaceae bacterium]|nr:DUF4234 domain-containing protein [Defluviitaleaceae bacterium]
MALSPQEMKRELPMLILLTFVTCGIYGIYWYYMLLTNMYELNKQENTAVMDIVLSLVTCNLYFIYLAHKLGKVESAVQSRYGMPEKDDSLLYLILAVVGLGIVVYALLQLNLNKLVDHNGGNITPQ